MNFPGCFVLNHCMQACHTISVNNDGNFSPTLQAEVCYNWRIWYLSLSQTCKPWTFILTREFEYYHCMLDSSESSLWRHYQFLTAVTKFCRTAFPLPLNHIQCGRYSLWNFCSKLSQCNVLWQYNLLAQDHELCNSMSLLALGHGYGLNVASYCCF